MPKKECEREHGAILPFLSPVKKSPGATLNFKRGSTLIQGGHKEDDWAGPLPKGWTGKSRASFYKSMSQADHEEGPTAACMKKIAGHVDDPGAFCASLRDQVTGTTHWRHGGKKK